MAECILQPAVSGYFQDVELRCAHGGVPPASRPNPKGQREIPPAGPPISRGGEKRRGRKPRSKSRRRARRSSNARFILPAVHKTSVSDYINTWHLRVLTLVMLIQLTMVILFINDNSGWKHQSSIRRWHLVQTAGPRLGPDRRARAVKSQSHRSILQQAAVSIVRTTRLKTQIWHLV